MSDNNRRTLEILGETVTVRFFYDEEDGRYYVECVELVEDGETSPVGRGATLAEAIKEFTDEYEDWYGLWDEEKKEFYPDPKRLIGIDPWEIA